MTNWLNIQSNVLNLNQKGIGMGPLDSLWFVLGAVLLFLWLAAITFLIAHAIKTNNFYVLFIGIFLSGFLWGAFWTCLILYLIEKDRFVVMHQINTPNMPQPKSKILKNTKKNK